jgi:hypothetical protein
MIPEQRTYMVTVRSGNPDADLDTAIEAAMAWMVQDMDPERHHELAVTVVDTDGTGIVGYVYEPEQDSDAARCTKCGGLLPVSEAAAGYTTHERCVLPEIAPAAGEGC